MVRRKFNDFVKKTLRHKGTTVEQLANEIDVSSATLRSWIQRNKFPRHELLKIATVVGLDTDEESLESNFVFERTRDMRALSRQEKHLTELLEKKGEDKNSPDNVTLPDILELIDVSFDRGKLQRDFSKDVKQLFSSMQKGDVFCYVSLDEFPYEMTQTAWSSAGIFIAEAINEGARFIYLFPSEELLDNMYECGLLGLPEAKSFTRLFNKFSENIYEELRKKNHAASDEEIKNTIVDNLLMVEITGDQSPFLTPGHKYVTFIHEGLMRALARFPTGSSEQDRHLHVPLDSKTTEYLVQFITKILKDNKISL